MKYLITFVLLISASLNAQESKVLNKIDKNTFELIYLDNSGNILQKGFIKNKMLHGEWSSYDGNGKKLVSGTYEKGKKVGKWFFRNYNKITEVDYENNLPIKVVNWDNPVVTIAEKD